MPEYHLKREDKKIGDSDEVFAILKRGQYASLALCLNDEPYIITMNYGFDREKNALYFHCALEGQKLDFIEKNPNACGTVIEDLGYGHGECNHYYKSVIFRGKICLVDSQDEKRYGIDVMIRHLEEKPDEVKARLLKDKKTYGKFHILRLDIEEITGKQALKKD